MLQQLGRPGDRDVILRTYIDIRPSGVYMRASPCSATTSTSPAGFHSCDQQPVPVVPATTVGISSNWQQLSCQQQQRQQHHQQHHGAAPACDGPSGQKQPQLRLSCYSGWVISATGPLRGHVAGVWTCRQTFRLVSRRPGPETCIGVRFAHGVQYTATIQSTWIVRSSAPLRGDHQITCQPYPGFEHRGR